jgi:uncharacterized protein (DUF1501 family)
MPPPPAALGPDEVRTLVSELCHRGAADPAACLAANGLYRNAVTVREPAELIRAVDQRVLGQPGSAEDLRQRIMFQRMTMSNHAFYVFDPTYEAMVVLLANSRCVGATAGSPRGRARVSALHRVDPGSGCGAFPTGADGRHLGAIGGATVNPLNRRSFLSGVVGAGVALRLRSVAGAAQASPAGRRPRMLIHILAQGGIDAILTTNPKSKSSIDPRVDLPYGEREITESGPVALGPLFAPLAPYLKHAAILNGVAGGTVAHLYGVRQAHQLRSRFPSGSPGLTGTIGAALGAGTPLTDARFLPADPFLDVDPSNGRSMTFRAFRRREMNLLEGLSRIAHNEQRRAVTLSALARARQTGTSAERLPLEVVEAVLGRLAPHELPPLPELEEAHNAQILRDTLALLRFRVAPTVFIHTGDWDTHADNEVLQRKAAKDFIPFMQALFDGISSQRTIDGSLLADEVGVVIMSELGRFPILNPAEGKDHFPELPVILMGPGIRPGMYGETDMLMAARPISFRTGKPSGAADDRVPTVDDLGATILSWFGVQERESLGYTGEPISALLDV